MDKLGINVSLLEITSSLAEHDPELTIYARRPWRTDAEAIPAWDSEDGTPPPAATERGLDYFLEIFISLEVLNGWIKQLNDPPSAEAACQRLIAYAENDA